MAKFKLWLTTFGYKILAVLDTFVDGVKLQMVSFKGALLMLFLTALVVDVVFVGRLGIVSYLFALGKDAFAVVNEQLKSNGWQFIILLAILLMFKKSKV